MRLETRKFLYDVQQACELLGQFIEGKSLSDYLSDPLLRSAVERQLMIVGEALYQAFQIDRSLGERITDLQAIIRFRHILVHGYSVVENDTVWGILQNDLPTVRDEGQRLLAEADEDG